MDRMQMIFRRKSVRSYTGEPVSAELLGEIYALPLTPLYPEIAVRWEIVGRNQVKCLCPWTTPQVITIYSEETDGYLENVGFLFQQLELQLQAMGLGVCWLGMGRLNQASVPQADDNLRFVIMLAFGHPKGDALRPDAESFKRKPMTAISDQPDSRLEPARLAPSSVNSQPWYFLHDGDMIHVFCAYSGILGRSLSEMNRIDIGIALSHLWICNTDNFRFFRTETPPSLRGYGYIGTIII